LVSAADGPGGSVAVDDLRWLDADALAFQWTGGTAPIYLTLANDRSYLWVYALDLYPSTAPGTFVEFFGSGVDGRRSTSIGILRGLSELTRPNREAVEECLRRSYIVPTITRVLDIRPAPSAPGRRVPAAVRVRAETSRGPCTFELDNVYDQLKRLPGGRVVMTDVTRNRYEVPDITRLDGASRRWLDRYV
jgi:hypothetical protein